jgi:hypothetical protein
VNHVVDTYAIEPRLASLPRQFTLDRLIDLLLMEDECEYECQEWYTEREITALALEAIRLLRQELCSYCGENTILLDEYYMVRDDLWDRYGACDGMLCIGCLETRLGRKLTPADFNDIPLNFKDDRDRSDRLRDRLGLPPVLDDGTAA